MRWGYTSLARRYFLLLNNLNEIEMKYMKWMIGIVLGAIAGFSYWYFIGCNTGTCAITSSPINSTLYGSLMGLLLVNTFSSDDKKAESKEKSV